MIHTIYPEMIQLLKTLMGRFLKEACFGSMVNEEILQVEVDKGHNWCHVDIGCDTEKAISSLPEKDKKDIVLGARKFYTAAVCYLLKVLPLKNEILKNMACLQPSQRLGEKSLNSIKFLAMQLPQVVSVADVSDLCDEYIRYQGEDLSDICYDSCVSNLEEYSSDNEDVSPLPELSARAPPVDKYWAQVLKKSDANGNLKYKLLGKLVKALLSLPHGNADVERGFSVNKRLLANRTTLSVESIDGLRKIKSHVKVNCDNDVRNFDINSDVLKNVKMAYQRKCERQKVVKNKLKYKRKSVLQKIQKKN